MNFSMHSRFSATFILTLGLQSLFTGLTIARAAENAEVEPLREVMRHDGAITMLLFNPSGRGILSAGVDGAVRFWNSATGKPAREEIRFDPNLMRVLAVSPDCTKMLVRLPTTEQALRGSVVTFCFWDVLARKPIGEPIVQKQRALYAAFSPDSSTVITGDWGTKRFGIWDATTGKLLNEPECAIGRAKFSRDGKSVLILHNKQASLWNVATGAAIGEPLKPQHDHSMFSGADLSPHGRTIVTLEGDGMLQLWDATSSKKRERIQDPTTKAAFVQAAFSPDGRTIITADNERRAQLWDVATGKSLGPPMPHNDDIGAMVISPNGRILACQDGDYAVQMWDVASGKPIGQPLWHFRGVIKFLRPAQEARIPTIIFSPDSQILATGGEEGVIHLWNVHTGAFLNKPHPERLRITDVCVSSDGRMLLSAGWDGTARMWDIASGKPIGEAMRHEGPVRRALFGRDGKIVVTFSVDNTARLWDATNGKPLGEIMRHSRGIRSMELSADSGTVVTLSGGAHAADTISVWDARTGGFRGTLPLLPHKAIRAAVSPDGNVIAVAMHGVPMIFRKSGEAWIGKPLQHTGMSSSIAISPDGRLVATADSASQEQTLRLWNCATGEPWSKQPPIPSGQGSSVDAITFSPDGNRVLVRTGSKCQLWDAKSHGKVGEPIAILQGIADAIFSPDSRTVLTRDFEKRPPNSMSPWGNNAIQLWDATSGKPLGEPLIQNNVVAAACFSPDGHTIFAASGDSVLFLDAKTGKASGKSIRHADP